jgi:hypothetical protein
MTKHSEILIYRAGYILFIVLGIYQLLFQKDFTSAASSFGIGLIFDPFDRDQKWPEKPVWQKTVLLSQLALAMSLLVYGIFWN